MNQMDPPALVEVEVPLRSAEGRGVSKAKIVDFYDLGYPDLSGLYYDGKRNELYVLSNEWNVLLVVNRSGKIVRKMPMPGYYDQEGITFDADGNIFFAQDAGGLTKVDFTYTLEQWQTVRRRSFSPLFVEIRRGPPFTQEAHIRVKNPLSSPGSGTINWNIRAQGVQIAPERYEYSVQPQGDIRVPFKVTFKEGTDLRYPLADYEATFIKAGTQTPIFITGKMRFTPSLVCRKRVRPISIDGDLQDWVRFKPLYLNRKE
nr:hypothetical protein [Desulfobacterales bacterium]